MQAATADEKKTALHLHFDAASRKLMATVVPDPAAAALDVATLRAMIEAGGWGQLRYLEEMSIGLIASHNAGTACSLPIAEAIDASLHLEISPDAMEAWLTLTPAAGGKVVSVQNVLDLLAENNVAEGIDLPAIETALRAGQVERAPVPRPCPATDGLSDWRHLPLWFADKAPYLHGEVHSGNEGIHCDQRWIPQLHCHDAGERHSEGA